MNSHVFFCLHLYRELLEQVAEFEKTDFKTTNKVQKPCFRIFKTFRHAAAYLHRHGCQRSAASLDIRVFLKRFSFNFFIWFAAKSRNKQTQVSAVEWRRGVGTS